MFNCDISRVVVARMPGRHTERKEGAVFKQIFKDQASNCSCFLPIDVVDHQADFRPFELFTDGNDSIGVFEY